MNLYCPDPKDGKPSVSLTVLWLSIAYLLTLGVLQAMGKVNDTGVAMEFFGISSALYFGRRVSFGGKDYSANNNDEEKK